MVAGCSTKNPEGTSIEIPSDSGSFELNEATILGLQENMQSGKFTSERLTNLYLNRIELLNKKGPKFNAVIELNPDAVSIAKQMDEERKAGKTRGPLHGIPVLIKDNIDTADKMMTTAGSLALAGNIAPKDAFIVTQLRNAGAVLLGKTNLSEWANFRSTRSSSGWSSRGGQTKNPYVLDRSPCGSSSGSGAAVAANLCVVAIGTETNGSIACPASMNGIVGIKPTVGLLSRSGIIPISKTQDTAGPMARTVTDAAIFLGMLAGEDAADAVTHESIAKAKKDYTPFLDINGLTGKRIGVEKSLLKHHEGVDALQAKALEQLKSKGAIIIEVEYMDKCSKVDAEEFQVLQYEFKDGLNKYLATAHGKVKNLKEVIAFNKQNETKAMPYFKQETLESSETKQGLDSKEYTDALQKLLTTTRGIIDNLLATEKLDALCGPATGAAWCIDVVNGDFWTGYGCYGPAAVAGYPSITVPMGNLNEIPIGLTFFGKAYDEPGLIAIAYAYEQASKNRILPKFKTALE